MGRVGGRVADEGDFGCRDGVVERGRRLVARELDLGDRSASIGSRVGCVRGISEVGRSNGRRREGLFRRFVRERARRVLCKRRSLRVLLWVRVETRRWIGGLLFALRPLCAVVECLGGWRGLSRRTRRRRIGGHLARREPRSGRYPRSVTSVYPASAVPALPAPCERVSGCLARRGDERSREASCWRGTKAG